MFDFDGELAELREKNAAQQAAKREEEKRRHGIFSALAQNANTFLEKRSLNFRAEMSERGVEIISMGGAMLRISMNHEGNFDVFGGVNDVNSPKYISKKGILEKEVTQLIVKWTMGI